MLQPEDILSVAMNRPVTGCGLERVHHKFQRVPGTVQYTMSRFIDPSQSAVEDSALMAYHFVELAHPDNNLTLVFCITGNRYCPVSECGHCRRGMAADCPGATSTIDVASFRFTAGHLARFIKNARTSTFSESVLNFRHTHSFSRSLPVCGQFRSVLESLLNQRYEESLENIFINAQSQMLLLRCMECMTGDNESFTGCKFLANESDRGKIALARQVLLEHIGAPLTIRELSRKAAINECYLKKGFREMYGTTIFDFYQSQRMEHAKYLLYEKGLSVTDVSDLLGYSSISHFSTAFKKHTGLKPCELLLR